MQSRHTWTFGRKSLFETHIARRLVESIILIISIVIPIQAGAAAGSANPAPGLMVRVGEHRLHLNCIGQGQPTVVLESGLGGNSLDWTRVQPGVARYARVCAYDRAGYGWSEMGPLPRTGERIAEELHTLLQQAGVPGPYVLVGHSFGGYSIRLFASHYPEETAGIILLDAAHEDQFKQFRKNGIAQHTAGVTFMMSGPAVPDNLPDDIRPLALKLVQSTNAYLALRGEMISFQHSAKQVRESGPLPDVPYVVITRGKRVWPSTERGDRMETIWKELQDDLATRTLYHRSDVDSAHLIAKNSGHYVHLDEPDMVVNTIQKLVESGRRLASAENI